MGAITKTISTTQERVDFLEDNKVSLSLLFNEAVDNLKRQINNVVVENLRAKIKSIDQFYQKKLVELRVENEQLKKRLEKTDELFEKVKGGLHG